MSDKHCGNCHYMGWRCLVRHCFHPAHPLPLKKSGMSCPEYFSDDRKLGPGETIPERVA